MKLLLTAILTVAIVAPVSSAFAGSSNPMSQGYNAVQRGPNETKRKENRMNAQKAKPAATQKNQ